MTPMMELRRVTSARATELRRYPSCSMAASTRDRVSSATWPVSLTTRETVWCDTPANLATSIIAGCRPPRAVSIADLPPSVPHPP